jgi:glycosyltransferase involved in cell wall biosynthesis
VSQAKHPLRRLTALTRLVLEFRPHVLQAGHFYTNLYVALAARACGAVAIGSIRNDTYYEMRTHGKWGPWLLRLPPTLLTNSWAAKENAEALGISPDRIRVLPNVIDLPAFDSSMAAGGLPAADHPPTLLTVCRLDPVKRVDRFLHVVKLLQPRVAGLRALVVGDGPERAALEALAVGLGLLPEVVEFLGSRNDVPALLRRSDVLLMTSEHEGFPNTILEAMAAGLPVVTTPVGDAPRVVVDGLTGYITELDDHMVAERLVPLLTSASLRKRLGTAGRGRVEALYSFEGLADRLLQMYRQIAVQQKHRCTETALSTW